MLPQCALPDEYATPDWWRPSKAAAVAVMAVEDVARVAEMHIMCKMLAGRLAFGSVSELQVCLAQTQKYCDKKLHFAPEAAVVDRIAGSVLSAAYKRDGCRFRDQVVLSWPLALAGQMQVQEQAGETGKVPSAASIYIVGRIDISSLQGATDCVFRLVTQEIEAIQRTATGLCLRRIALYASGQISKPLDITNRHHETADES